MNEFDPVTGEIRTLGEVIASLPAPKPAPPPSANLLATGGALVGSAYTHELWSAMIKAQSTMRNPKRTKPVTITSRRTGESYTYKYAPIEKIVEALKPTLMANQLWYQQGLVYRAQGQPFIRTCVYHSSGQWTATDYPVFPDGDTWQAFDAAVTRASRRSLMLAFGITPEDDNEAVTNDARAAVRPARTHATKGPRYAGAFSSASPDDQQNAESPQWHDPVGEGWEAASRGVAALMAFADGIKLTETQRRGDRFQEQLKTAQAVDVISRSREK